LVIFVLNYVSKRTVLHRVIRLDITGRPIKLRESIDLTSFTFESVIFKMGIRVHLSTLHETTNNQHHQRINRGNDYRLLLYDFGNHR